MNKIKVTNLADVISGVIISIAILFFTSYMIPVYCVDPSDIGSVLKPSGFVYIISRIILASSVWLIISGLFFPSGNNASENADAQEKMTSREWLRVIYTSTIFIVYIIAVDYLGFYISSILFMVLLMFFFGTRKWYLMAANIAVVIFFIFLVFNLALKVILPEGSLLAY
jgi:putative tricarboxylic transport membrane protein